MVSNFLTQIITKRKLSDDEQRAIDGRNIDATVDLSKSLDSGEYIHLMNLSSGETHLAFNFLDNLRGKGIDIGTNKNRYSYKIPFVGKNKRELRAYLR